MTRIHCCARDNSRSNTGDGQPSDGANGVAVTSDKAEMPGRTTAHLDGAAAGQHEGDRNMICPRCRKPMVQNAYADPGDWQCNRCGLVLVLNADGEIISTNETCGRAYILGATGGAARGHTNGRYSFTPRSNQARKKNQRGVSRHSDRD